MAKVKELFIDLETYSSVDLRKCGVYKYAAAPDFQILLFAYSQDAGPVQVIDLASGQTIPPEIMAAITDPKVTKWAYNAAFERVCLSAFTGKVLNPCQWKCTMVWSAYLGLPASLDMVGKVLGLEKQKLQSGTSLINTFSKPSRTGKQTLPTDQPDKWEKFIEYNRRDVETETQIHQRLTKHPMPEKEWEYYWLDQKINDTGIAVDTVLAGKAVEMNDYYKTRCLEEMKEITGLENPNSNTQLLGWLNQNGSQITSLAKADVSKELETATGQIAQVLRLRQLTSKTSTSKYEAMSRVTGKDGRARGLLQFYGANRTGRWAGRLIQVQNLPRNNLTNLEGARDLARLGDADSIEVLFDCLPETMSELIRTAFIPKPGHRFIVADFSAIEARVIAWLAGEKWRLKLFEAGGDIYCQSASKMFKVPVEKHGQNADLRQKGKIAELACGYQGSVGALKAMGAEAMGLSENEMNQIVTSWRTSNPAIVRLWADTQKGAVQAIKTGQKQIIGPIAIQHKAKCLFITLPSGRDLVYPRPQITTNEYGGTGITFMGSSLNRQWAPVDTYGGKLVENIVQATARDLLAEAMSHVAAAGHTIVMHIHDEIVVETPTSQNVTVQEICDLMNQTPPWATGLPLDADGYECGFYQKQ